MSYDTVAKYAQRNEDFPEPKIGGDTTHPYYSEREFLNWYMDKFPDRTLALPRWLHLFEVSTPTTTHRVLKHGPGAEVVAYMRAYRDIKYPDWKITTSADGFVARKDGTIHVAALDTEEPEEWFVYEQRILATGSRKGER